jgi:Ca2+-binding RTX toxin-like protein
MKNSTLLLLLVFLSACDHPVILGASEETEINSLESLQRFIDNGIENGYFPAQIVSNDPSIQPRLEDITLEFRTIINWESRSTCPQHEDQIILALSDENQSVQCGFGDTVILLGQGNDWVDDSWGNDIIYPGAGNDIINTGNGNDIVIFDENWGHDTLTIHSRKLEKESLSFAPFKLFWNVQGGSQPEKV